MRQVRAVPASRKWVLFAYVVVAFGFLSGACNCEGDNGLHSTRCDPTDPALAHNFSDPGAVEKCDIPGVDDDCDGLVDEICDCFDRDIHVCGTNIGLCRTATVTCVNGQFPDCIPEATPSAEICDGADNDCDGKTDAEDGDLVMVRFPGGGCWTSSITVVFKHEYEHSRCVEGTPACVDSVEVCQGQEFPWDYEECNFKDDDCDGVADEDTIEERFAETGERKPCGTDVGICQTGVQICIGGEVVCGNNPEPGQQYVPPRTEICNGGVDENFEPIGLDDDCDDEANEDLVRTCGTEFCPGEETCDELGNWTGCTAQVPLPVEYCDDGIDNDCDGEVDEDCSCQPFVDIQDCSENVVVNNPYNRDCGLGIQFCQADGSWGPCTFTSTIPEQCNFGHDDDCDEATTELDVEPRVCGTDEGECETGLQYCLIDGTWNPMCDGAIFPRAEICDDEDNDCDGVVNNGIIRRNAAAILIGADCSGSMCAYTPNVAIASSSFMGNLAGSPHVCMVVGIPGGSSVAYTALTPGFVSPEECQAVLATLGCNCGGNEWNLDYLLDASSPMSSIPWPADKFPFIIYIGDEPNQTLQGPLAATVMTVTSNVAAQTTTCQLPGCQPPGCDPANGCTPGPPEVFVMESPVYETSYAAILNNTANPRYRFCDILQNDPAAYEACMEAWFQDICF